MKEEKYLEYLGVRVKGVQAACENCLRYHDGAPCPPKEDHESCKDFVPVDFTSGYIYTSNKWLKIIGKEE